MGRHRIGEIYYDSLEINPSKTIKKITTTKINAYPTAISMALNPYPRARVKKTVKTDGHKKLAKNVDIVVGQAGLGQDASGRAR